MRTNVDIDDALLAEAMKVSGQSTKKATIDEALRRMVTQAQQRQALDNLWGAGWVGDLEEMRNGWRPPEPI